MISFFNEMHNELFFILFFRSPLGTTLRMSFNLGLYAIFASLVFVFFFCVSPFTSVYTKISFGREYSQRLKNYYSGLFQLVCRISTTALLYIVWVLYSSGDINLSHENRLRYSQPTFLNY